jgi:molybdate transport system permease protein
MTRGASSVGRAAGALLVVFLVLPLLGLVLGSSPAEVVAALGTERCQAALGVSLRTTSVTAGLLLMTGIPLAWRLSRHARPSAPMMALLELPIVLPPAVLGIALLATFGRAGLLGDAIGGFGVTIPFTAAAVVIAQVVVAAPLFVITATEAFRRVDDDLILVARTLGASPARTWVRVALPAALPGLTSALALAWARALGEFGATLMFAGNLPDRTQTVPLAIYGALGTDLAEARALAIVLVLTALVPLLIVRLIGATRA